MRSILISFTDEQGIRHEVPKTAVTLNANGEIVGYNPEAIKKVEYRKISKFPSPPKVET